MRTDCDRVTRTADDFLEHRMNWRARAGFALHLATCRGCRTWLEQFRLTILALGSLPEPGRAEASEDLLERFRREKRERG